MYLNIYIVCAHIYIFICVLICCTCFVRGIIPAELPKEGEKMHFGLGGHLCKLSFLSDRLFCQRTADAYERNRPFIYVMWYIPF